MARKVWLQPLKTHIISLAELPALPALLLSLLLSLVLLVLCCYCFTVLCLPFFFLSFFLSFFLLVLIFVVLCLAASFRFDLCVLMCGWQVFRLYSGGGSCFVFAFCLVGFFPCLVSLTSFYRYLIVFRRK